jgi:hypothetical protein
LLCILRLFLFGFLLLIDFWDRLICFLKSNLLLFFWICICLAVFFCRLSSFYVDFTNNCFFDNCFLLFVFFW